MLKRLFGGIQEKIVIRYFSTSPNCLNSVTTNHKLLEFFDDKKNWGQSEVKVGRSWKKPELRIKSNSDLHKLWFVLLKEKNMLLTMEHECKEQTQLFPNPERIDKVEESMKNLEDVVRERNEAYFMLETGETGERPGYVRTGQLGLKFNYRMTEHYIPKFMNRKWQKDHKSYAHTRDVREFLKLYREKQLRRELYKQRKERDEAIAMLKKFPNVDNEALKSQFPSIGLDEIHDFMKEQGQPVR